MEKEYCIVDDEKGMEKSLQFLREEVECLYKRCDKLEKKNSELQEKMR